MARYGKTIKSVQELLRRAENKDVAVINRSGQEVYMAEIVEENTLYFYHYGTLTLKLELTGGNIEHYYGFSNSDRDSLNTVLDFYGVDSNKYFRIKQGEFILVEESRELELV